MGHLRGERLQRAATVCVDDLEEVGAVRWELLREDPGEDGCLPGISHDNGEAIYTVEAMGSMDFWWHDSKAEDQ